MATTQSQNHYYSQFPAGYISSAPCQALRALDYYVQFDSVSRTHYLFPSIRHELIKCIAVSHQNNRLDRDQLLWKHGQAIIQHQEKEIANTIYHLKVDHERWLPRIFNRTDVSASKFSFPFRAVLRLKSAQGPYREQETCQQALPIDGFRSSETTLFLILALVDKFCKITMSSGEQKEQATKLDPNEGILILVLAATQALFESRTSLPDKTFETVLEYGKKTLKRTQTNANTRLVVSNRILI